MGDLLKIEHRDFGRWPHREDFSPQTEYGWT